MTRKMIALAVMALSEGPRMVSGRYGSSLITPDMHPAASSAYMPLPGRPKEMVPYYRAFRR